MLNVIAPLMPEKREGQQIIRFFVDSEKKELFREYCQFTGQTMTEVLERYIDSLLGDENFQRYLSMKRELQELQEQQGR
jgi:hypothetical protein